MYRNPEHLVNMNLSLNPQPVQVLLQGFYLQSSNCDDIVKNISEDITALENELSTVTGRYSVT